MVFLNTEQFFFWLIISVIFFILEMGSPGLFFFISFGLGAIASAGVSLYVMSFVYQMAVFLCTSIGAFIFLRWWTKKYILKKHTILTNASALIGKQAQVIKPISCFQLGQVRVAGQVWSAKALDQSQITVGVIVEITDVKGAHVVVRKINEHDKELYQERMQS